MTTFMASNSVGITTSLHWCADMVRRRKSPPKVFWCFFSRYDVIIKTLAAPSMSPADTGPARVMTDAALHAWAPQNLGRIVFRPRERMSAS